MSIVPVFDLGKVLLDFDFGRFEQRLVAACRPGAPAAEIVHAHWRRVRPEIGGDFDSVHPELVREAGLTLSLAELRLAWNDIFTPIAGMAELVGETPRPRYLLSTINEPHVTWIRERYGYVFELFDRCFLSNEIGAAKPEPAIYQHLEQQTGVAAARLAFVDDLEENVAAARARGWRALRFTGVEACRRWFGEIATEMSLK